MKAGEGFVSSFCRLIDAMVLGTPADIRNAVTLLCSEEAGWITGQLIAVDGGASLMDGALPLEIQQPQRAKTAA
jgi:NAD(P)-dependent dehydrogenase (short-subunit alcohol dehydrogenase family)